MDIKEIVMKLVGNINPAGCSTRDEKSFENLKTLCQLVEDLTEEIQFVTRSKDSYEGSVKRSGEFAHNFINENSGVVDDRWRIWSDLTKLGLSEDSVHNIIFEK